MRLARIFIATTVVFLLIAGFVVLQNVVSTWGMVVQNWVIVNEALVLHRIEVLGIFAIGWGVGVTAWLVIGHQALLCFFEKVPRAWSLWRKDVLKSSLPVHKYLIGGILLLGLGAFLVKQLWGLWIGAYSMGFIAGAIIGGIHSITTVGDIGSPIDFLDANQRYVNEDKVSLFTQSKKP